MDAPGRFICNYVGKVSLAKGYGIFPLYGLTRSAAPGRGAADRARPVASPAAQVRAIRTLG
jgi:hypothetical protein